jgi:uncharacterized protein (TIRG00374 family)
MQSMKKSRSLLVILKLLFTILLLFLVFQSIDISRLRGDLQTFRLLSLFLLLVICWMGQLLCSERWRVFASSLQMNGSYLSFVQMYFIGMFFNIGLPSLVGGDAIKAYLLSRKNGRPLHFGLASVLQDRAAGLITLLLYGSIAALIHPLSWQGFSLANLYLLTWIGVAFGLWLVWKGDVLYRKFIVAGGNTFLQKVLRTLAEFHQALGMSRLKPDAFLKITLYSFINSALVLCVFQQVTVAAGHKVGIIPFSALYPLVTLATMLPITLSGLGIREWVYVEALFLAGVPRGTGLAISLATSALLLVCNLGGLFFLPAVPAELRRQVRNLRGNGAGKA